MSAHALYVAAAYGLSALGIAGLVAWIVFDGHMQRRAYAALERRGVRRRSQPAGAERP
ncbi:MAG: heme exporter protein CcmD [Mesorhizobium sp.]